MARPAKKRKDHRGAFLPAGVYPQRDGTGEISGYKVRWREENFDGVGRHSARTFSAAIVGSLDRALLAAVEFREQAVRVARAEGSMVRADPAVAMTVDELFSEWCVGRGPELSERYAEGSIRIWEREISARQIAKLRLARISQDPAAITRFQDQLLAEGMSAGNRAKVLSLLRAVLRWGRRRHPNVLRLELSGLFELPRSSRKRLAFATDAYGLERLIEAVLRREAHDDLLPLRDAAFVAAMGFTVAARPSEWLYSARWADLHQRSVEFQRSADGDGSGGVGLKTGARAALVLPSASERICAYRERLEERFGAQPENALVFQALGSEGPLWSEDGDEEGDPVAWTDSEYKNWTSRVWRKARAQAATIEQAPAGLETMRFYDCRHTAISMALHSTLVMGPHGMNLHSLAAWAGHDVQTLQRYYAHSIARYLGGEPIDLDQECRTARERVEANPATYVRGA